MLKLLASFLSIFLILIIFLKIPEKNAGLSTLTSQSNLLGSPRSTGRFLNILIGIGVVSYLYIALRLNFLKM